MLLLLRVSLDTLCRCRLINLPSSLDDPLILLDVRWLVVPAERHHYLPSVDRDDRSAVTNVGAVAGFSNYQNYDCARTRSIDNNRISVFITALAHLYESILCLFETLDDGVFWVLREAILLDHEVMELIPEELCTSVSSMPVVHPKKAAFWPILVLAMGWFSNIQND